MVRRRRCPTGTRRSKSGKTCRRKTTKRKPVRRRPPKKKQFISRRTLNKFFNN